MGSESLREEIMLLTDAGLACYDDGRWLVGGLYFRSIEVGDAVVIEQCVILPYPHPHSRLLAIDTKVEGEVGQQTVVLVGVHGSVSRMLLLPLMHFFADILAPTFGMKLGKVVFSMQLGPRSLRLPLKKDVGIWRRGRRGRRGIQIHCRGRKWTVEQGGADRDSGIGG